MTDKIEECSCPKEMADCKDEDKVDGKCPEVKAETIPSWAQGLQKSLETIQTNYTNVQGQLEKLKTLEAQAGIREIPKPEAIVSKQDDESILSKSMEKVMKWVENGREGSCTVTIPVEKLREFNVVRTSTPNGVQETFRSNNDKNIVIKEALGFTGTQSSQQSVLPPHMETGSTSFVPVTQFSQYKTLKQGENIARYFKYDLPSTLSQTPGTTATEGTMDIESVEVTPSTITGVYLKVDSDDIENNPYDTMAVVLGASAAKYDDFVATDMLDTISAEGTLSLSTGNWIKGSDGTNITTSDTASVAFDHIALATAAERLEDLGYISKYGQPVAFLAPKQFRQLVTDTDLNNYVQFARDDITTSHNMAEIHGVKIVRTNAVEKKTTQTNPAYNGIVCIPGHSYGTASARNVTVKLHEIAEDNQIRAVTNWRVKSVVVDKESILRISSTA